MINHLSEQHFYELYYDYLQIRGFNVDKIPKQKYQTPDLKIFNENIILLNEVKIPELIIDPLLKIFVYKTINSKLLKRINTALKQFNKFDNGHRVPWIITFAANKMQMNWSKFNNILGGGVELEGKLNPDFTKTEEFSRMEDKLKIPDLYIWFQVGEDSKKIHQTSFFINPLSIHLTEISKFVNELKILPTGPMDNEIIITWGKSKKF